MKNIILPLFISLLILTANTALFSSEFRKDLKFADRHGLSNEEKLKEYDNEKITFDFKEKFDPLYPANTKVFYFKKGKEPITFQEFLNITNDPNLLKLNSKIKNTKIAGITTACIFGGVTVLLLIPTIIFITRQTNNNQIFNEYYITGNVGIALVCASFLGLLIDLIVMFSVLYRYKYSDQSIKSAAENYNEKLRQRLGIMPDISFDGFNNNDIDLSLAFRL